MEPLHEPRVFSNRYELTHLVARGGMAEVYRAVDRLLDRPVALKVLFPELSVDRTFVERFRREAQAAANLSHPNIVPVFDWGEDSGTYFIVMEYVDGNPLSAVLKAQGALPPDRAVAVAAPVAAALGYAHRHGVVHRDVKPGNVLLTTDGQVKVTDFGIARAINTEESLTQTGAVMGTATYFSPEQAEGSGVDSRSDIYSLGVVLYEMLTGRPPFLGETPVSVASKHVRDQPPLPRELEPSVPPALENIVMQALAKSPEQRYQTAEELRSDLLRFAEGQPVTAPSAAVTSVLAPVGAAGTTQVVGAVGGAHTQALPATGEPGRDEDADQEDHRKRARRLALLLVVLLVVLGVIIYFLGQSLGYWGGSTTSVSVPDVSGQTVSAATSTLRAEGLTVAGKITIASSDPKGIVVRTVPAAHQSVNKGSGVTLYVSGGASVTKVTVPYVENQSLQDAETHLRAVGLTPTAVQKPDADVPTNTVFAQDPKPGTRVPKGHSVTLTVSTGPPATTTTVPPTTTTSPTTTVPNVICQTPSNAAQILGNAGLQVGSTSSQVSSVCASGLVVATSPGVGSSVNRGSSVNLVLSSGTPATTTTTAPPPTTTTTTPPGPPHP